MGGAIKSESGSKLVLRHGKITGSGVAITATDSTVQIEDVYAEVGVVVEGENVDIEANRITHVESPSRPDNLTLSKDDWRPVNGYD